MSLRNIFVSLHFLPQSGGTVVLEEVPSLMLPIYFVVTEVIFFSKSFVLETLSGTNHHSDYLTFFSSKCF